jgi:ATP-dependent Clp protease ATP-binding subunit ClpC
MLMLPPPHPWQVVTLDMGLLVAGTKYRGEFEERLKKLMDEIKQSDDIILVSEEWDREDNV